MSTQLDPDARCRTAKQMAHADLPSLQEGDESYRLVSAQSRSQDGVHTLLRDEEGWTLHVRYFARLQDLSVTTVSLAVDPVAAREMADRMRAATACTAEEMPAPEHIQMVTGPDGRRFERILPEVDGMDATLLAWDGTRFCAHFEDRPREATYDLLAALKRLEASATP